MSPNGLNDIDVIILCGGAGTRLRESVPHLPKALADVAGRPFLDHLLDKIYSVGLGRIVLAVGYMKEKIIARYGRSSGIIFSEESFPLGTGGAVRNALPHLQRENVLVINGDTIFDLPHKDSFEAHIALDAPLTILTTRVSSQRSDAGNVLVGKDGKVISFSEKDGLPGDRSISCGAYYMKKSLIESMPTFPFSLETDFFPVVASKKMAYAFDTGKKMLDIGTKERYGAAQNTYNEFI